MYYSILRCLSFSNIVVLNWKNGRESFVFLEIGVLDTRFSQSNHHITDSHYTSAPNRDRDFYQIHCTLIKSHDCTLGNTRRGHRIFMATARSLHARVTDTVHGHTALSLRMMTPTTMPGLRAIRTSEQKGKEAQMRDRLSSSIYF